jgi:hypothetical protein
MSQRALPPGLSLFGGIKAIEAGYYLRAVKELRSDGGLLGGGGGAKPSPRAKPGKEGMAPATNAAATATAGMLFG